MEVARWRVDHISRLLEEEGGGGGGAGECIEEKEWVRMRRRGMRRGKESWIKCR